MNLQIVLFHFIIQSLPGYSQLGGNRRQVSVTSVNGQFDHLLFHIFERFVPVNKSGRHRFEKEIGRFDGSSFTHHPRFLHSMRQLPVSARPFIF